MDGRCGHGHLSSFGCKLYGVAQQIPQHLQHAFRIQPCRGQRTVDGGFYCDLLGLDERRDFGNRPPYQRIEVNGLELVIQHPRFHFGQIQQ